MRPPVDVWQGCSGHWQSAFIRENLLHLGHAAWQGYLTHGRGIVACQVEAVDSTPIDWSGDVVQYSIQYIPAAAFPAYIHDGHLSSDLIYRLAESVQKYVPAQEILIAIGGNGPIEIDWLQNLVVLPPDCHHQLCNRWDEFNLESKLNGRYNDAES